MGVVFGAFPGGEHGDPPQRVLKEAGARWGKEFGAENDVQPPGACVQASGLEYLSVPS